jgi:hypothetical protein
MPIIRANVNRESAVMTDAASWYKYLGAYVTANEKATLIWKAHG